MKKTIFILALATLAITSCKENQKADALQQEVITTEETNSPTVEVDASSQPVNSQEKLVKEAQSKPLTTLILSQSHYDFGKVKKGEKVDHDYEITNNGNNPLIISHVKPGCGCTAPEFTKEPILPGQKGKITLSFDSSNFDGQQYKQAEVYANVEKAPIVITFSADVQSK